MQRGIYADSSKSEISSDMREFAMKFKLSESQLVAGVNLKLMYMLMQFLLEETTTKRLYDDEETDDDNLFDLIDSMYDKN